MAVASASPAAPDLAPSVPQAVVTDDAPKTEPDAPPAVTVDHDADDEVLESERLDAETRSVPDSVPDSEAKPEVAADSVIESSTEAAESPAPMEMSAAVDEPAESEAMVSDPKDEAESSEDISAVDQDDSWPPPEAEHHP